MHSPTKSFPPTSLTTLEVGILVVILPILWVPKKTEVEIMN
jgi:hypothetical protein